MPASGVFCVSKGMIALRSYRHDGSSVLVRLARPGDIFGFRSFLANGPHQTEAAALVPSKVCIVASRPARRVVAGAPRALDRIARRCAVELAAVREGQRGVAGASNRKRLAELILQIDAAVAPENNDDNGAMRLRLPLARDDIAAALGIAPETVSRLFGRLRDDGVLRVSGRWVTCTDRALLRDVA